MHFSVYDGYCIYFEKINQIYNIHRKPNKNTIPIYFRFMMGIAQSKFALTGFLRAGGRGIEGGLSLSIFGGHYEFRKRLVCGGEISL